jgi:predicted ArsR family transcriptional regulator
MQSTKEQILARIMMAGPSTVDSISREFGLARMTVRQHLAVLERDGLVTSREERQARGRPHLVYSLTEGGEESFPKRYQRLAELALDEVAALDAAEIVGKSPAEKKGLLLMKIAERLFHEHEDRVRDKPLGDRVAIVTDILTEEGGFAEWKANRGEFEITDHNCVYRRVVDTHPQLCEWHVLLLGQLLGKDVEETELISEGAESCRFVIKEREPTTINAKGTA